MSNNVSTTTCSWHGCSRKACVQSDTPSATNQIPYQDHQEPVCQFHYNGGVFGIGGTFDSYSLIEEDFVNFIKIIPLEKVNLKVVSPFLSDIILRTGSNVDIFLNEWLKCPDFNGDSEVTEIRKKRKTIQDYYRVFFDRMELKETHVTVRHLAEKIYPFSRWTPGSPPEWWTAYNKIKHGGFSERSHATLKNALFGLAALLILHERNWHSLKHIAYFCLPPSGLYGGLIREVKAIRTPLDTRRYLFKIKTNFATTSQSDDGYPLWQNDGTSVNNFRPIQALSHPKRLHFFPRLTAIFRRFSPFSNCS